MPLTQVTSGGIKDGTITSANLSDSGVTAGTHGSATAIPGITVNSKGLITGVTTHNISTGFESGTKLLFQQTNAPTGWTKSTTHNDKALRVVNGVASSGGTTAFTSVFSSTRTSNGSIGSTTLTTSQMPSHSHTIPRATNLNNSNDTCLSTQGVSGNVTTASAGGGGSHTHSFTGGAMDFAVQYVDVIIATKD